MLPIPLPSGVPSWAVKLGGVLILAAALIIGYVSWAEHQQGIGEARATERYNAAIAAQKIEASKILVRETARVTAAERRLQDIKNQQEVKDATNKKITDTMAARLRALAGPGGRLRDPNADAGCGHGGSAANGSLSAPTGDRPNDGTDAAGVLSRELTEFLFSQAASADKINLAYISCRADAEAARNGR